MRSPRSRAAPVRVRNAHGQRGPRRTLPHSSSFLHRTVSDMVAHIPASEEDGEASSRRTGLVRVTRERCASTGASTSFVYSLSDEEGADVDPKKFWEDEGVESVAFMRRLADDDAAAGGGPAASCAPDGARGGENRAVWGLTVARKRGARGAEPGGARAGAGEEDAGDQSGCFIVTTTSASCSLVGSGGDCHLCTRFTLTPACRRVDGSRQANEIVDTSWLL